MAGKKLGRFGLHPDPAIDFCTEVDALEGVFYDVEHSVFSEEDLPYRMEEMEFRLNRAIEFNVGGDKNSVRAKEKLRVLYERYNIFFNEKMQAKFDKFKQAVEDGNVALPTSKSEEDILLTDGHATLSFSSATEFVGKPAFSFCMADGGGFSSLLFTREQWEEMKKKVDNFIAKECQ
jgi:hypothetical protein